VNSTRNRACDRSAPALTRGEVTIAGRNPDRLAQARPRPSPTRSCSLPSLERLSHSKRRSPLSPASSRHDTSTPYRPVSWKQAPLGRDGTPEDVAQAIVGLLENTFLTGVVLPCDGGLRLT
jgi:hypothetical protein